MIQVGVIGASGYAGIELVRLLSQHPEVKLTAVTSEQSAGRSLAEVVPSFHRPDALTYEALDTEGLSRKADFFFVALPAGSAMDPVAKLLRADKKVVDLSPDYRLRNPEDYRRWYHHSHRHTGLLREAVYGLPEIYREKIRAARLVANPGCYPISVLLALIPILRNGLLDPSQPLTIDSKSGVSGAGRTPSLSYHYPEVQEGLMAYGLGGHRHLAEMQQELSALGAQAIRMTFTPHLVPMNRGILSTVYLTLNADLGGEALVGLFRDFYKGEPFVRILDPGISPNPHYLRGSNISQIGMTVNQKMRGAVLLCAIDNLVKGAAGQAIQNMNLMMGFEETLGLPPCGVFP